MQVNKLKRSKLKDMVDERILEFSQTRLAAELFKELCFCILTANYNAEKCIIIQAKIGNGFLILSENALARKLKELGYRFPNVRAKYIVEARKHNKELKRILDYDDQMLREWLVKNIKGLGYKESSHFLRNIGKKNFAIIDFHILDLLSAKGLIQKPKTLNKKTYLQTEELLKKLAKKLRLSLDELDLYLWYCETGKVLK